jgi:hypothetical protein
MINNKNKNKGFIVNLTDNKSNLYKLYIKGEYRKQIYNSFVKTNIIKNTIYEDETEIIYFSAENVITLNNYLNKQPNNKLDEKQCIQLINCLTKQIKYNELTNYGFFGFDLDDILVIDDNIFIIANANNLTHIINNNIIINYLFDKPYFNSPEILKINSIPAKIHYKTGYYSLGCLITYLLLNTYLLVGNEIKSEKEIEELLNPFNYTIIYWFLIRCLRSDVNNRLLLLV